MGDNNEQNKRIKDMQGLLKFCTEMTANEDTTEPSTYSTLTTERKEFLEKVFTELQIGTGKILADCLNKLMSESVDNAEDDIEDQKVALEQLTDYIPDLNYATDVLKLGGFPAIVRCLNSPHSSLRALSTNLIGEICQNYLQLQNEMKSLNVVLLLMKILNEDSDHNCRVSAMFAISCIVRNNSENEAIFLSNDGLSFIMRAIQSNIERLATKSIFFLIYLLKDELNVEKSIRMGFVEQLIHVIVNSDNYVIKEHGSNALLIFSAKNSAVSDFIKPELRFNQYLNTRLSFIQGKEQFQEEEEYITKLREVLYQESEDESIR